MPEDSAYRSLKDRADIIDLITKYAVSIDTRQWDDLGSCFADRFELYLVSTGAWVWFDRARIVDYVRHVFTQYDATQHISANHQITIDGDTAVCLSTLNATHHVADDPDGPIQRQFGYYRYELARKPEWRIVRMRQMLSWQEGNQKIFDRSHAGLGLPEKPAD
jgi:hypothetical protein